jgi:hypothetical protein
MAEVSQERRTRVRAANEKIVEKAEQLGIGGQVPLLCECGDPECSGIALTEAYTLRLVAMQPTWIITGNAHGARFAVSDRDTGEELLREED